MNHFSRDVPLGSLPRRTSRSAKISRYSLRVTLLKFVLPVGAVLLLAALAIAPSWHMGPEANRISYHVQPGTGAAPASRLSGASYHGTDQRGQPYTITADSAVQQGDGLVTLSAPAGDITLKSGTWLMLKSDSGQYQQQADTLDLAGNVSLYRNDGTVLTAPDAKIDLHGGSAATSSPVQVQGPFGTLTAQNGFTLTNRGAEVTFHGPATLILNQAQ